MNTIKLPDGRQAIVLTPVDSTELAIVHLPVIKRLIEHLPEVPFDRIRDRLIRNLMGAKDLKGMVHMLEDEVSFHKTVNLIEFLEPTDIEKAALIGDDISAGIAEANANIGALDD